MKILFVITGLGLGGAEQIVLNLAVDLVRRGHQVKVAYLKGQPRMPIPKQLELHGLGLDSVWALPRTWKRFQQLLADFTPDVVHAHLFHAIIFSRCMRLFLPMRYLISSVHSQAIGGALRHWAYRLTDRYSDINTNVSHEATEHFVAANVFQRQRSIAVPNGIDSKKFSYSAPQRQQLRQHYGLSADDMVFMAVGRLNAAKDYPNLLAAFAQFPPSLHRKLYIIGDGELQASLHELVQQQQLTAQVVFLGAQFHVEQLLSMADVFVLSSAWEGFGLVVAEAMSCERVVIATDCGGVREVLGDTNWLVPIHNSSALFDKMQQATQLTATEKTQIGQQHRQRIQAHYSLERMCEHWLGIYQKKKGIE